ncbi:MAG: response regulator [Planctomyces sp.]|nr:response regulator [Planctomyces sp.]
MSEPLRILLIDDDRDDFILTRDVLAETLRVPHQLDWASTYEAGLEALRDRAHDVYLLDYRLGKRTGLDLLRDPAALNSDRPIILLTGQGEREVDVEAMRAGAADYLPKSNIAEALERTIRYAVERRQDRNALRKLNEALERRVEERTADLEKANAALKEADRRKDEFIAILAHELRNPLAPISNSLALLKHAADNADICREARETMERQLEHMVRLIDDLLEVSRISRGKIELRRTAVDVRDIVSHAVEAARPLHDARHQQLVVDLPDQPLMLQADATRLTQVVGNLLNNACKFTPEGGRVELSARVAGGQCEIRVRDNGIGIDPAQVARIFEMFAQLDSSIDRAHGGLGIGLTLVRSLVELHNGTIEAHSPGRDQGTEFVVRLPLAPTAPNEKPAPVAAAPGEIPRRRILVVDDNRDSANTLSMLLRFDKHSVRCAYDGLDAVEQAGDFQPDVVLLDIGLPRLNGYDAARRIRELSGSRVVVLVAMTGWGQEEDRQRSRAAGFDFHLVKPVDRESLNRLLSGIPQPAFGG